jgi:purine-binding chemotaxis protein CheW
MSAFSASNSYLTCKLDKELFAIPVEQVIEIIEVSVITKIPQTPIYIRGVTNLRGNILPVIETRTKFAMETIKDTIDTCIVVLNVKVDEDEIQVGIVVDQVLEVATIEPSQIKPKPNIGRKYSNDYIIGIAQLANDFILVLDVNRVFSNDEIINMAELSSEELATS